MAAVSTSGTLGSIPQNPATASPASSVEELGEEEELNNTTTDSQWEKPESQGDTKLPPRPPVPLQKRRRVTRACDECRRKKIKCDGAVHCNHCQVYGYECTYDQPSNRRRNAAPAYVENLEIRLQRAEGLIRTYLPNIDLNDPSKDGSVVQQRPVGNPAYPNLPGLAAKPVLPHDLDHDGELRSMIETTGQLDLDEDGQWDFHGGSSGMVFMSRMRAQLGGLLGVDKSTPFLPKLPRPYPGNVAAFDSPKSVESPSGSEASPASELPSKEDARVLVEVSLGRACSLLRFVHGPTFMHMFDRIYDLPQESYGTAENKFLPLLYVVLALGCMFHTLPGEDAGEPSENTYKAGIDQGLKYFRTARSMMDITDCRDLTSLQTITFMIMFLQSTANLNSCYSYIGIALRSALRMGLHRNLGYKFNPIEREVRKRVFWVIRKMDLYVSALLGFPNMLDGEDIDQELPLEIDDEYITKDGISPMPKDKISLYAASNAHARLMIVLSKVIKNIYPVKGGLSQTMHSPQSPGYVVSHAKIKEIEGDLIQWFEKLPMALRPEAESTEDIVRAQQLLRLAYAHVQMMLYRPFLHYVSQKSQQGKLTDKRSYACAAACVSVSRNIIHITSEMRKRGLLIGAYWFTMYTTFFAIISLVYYVLENPSDAGSKQILADAMDGRDALKGFAQKSQAADRCSAALSGLFEKLPEKLKHDQAQAGQRKKRAAPILSAAPLAQNIPQGPRRQSKGPPEPVMGISRARTFPVVQGQSDMGALHPSRSSYDAPRFHIPTHSNPNLRGAFNEYHSPNVSGAGTPDSSRLSNSSLPAHHFHQGVPYSMSGTLPDMNAMMFPSEDPFAYPNQPMMEFDNFKREPMELISGSPAPGMFMPSSNPQSQQQQQGIYDDLEGQLFGPIPPYLAQSQQDFNMHPPPHPHAHLMGMMSGPPMTFQSGMTPNFDGMFSGAGGEGQEDWGNVHQRYRQ